MTTRDLNNSRPLDVHKWSTYPEVNKWVDALWDKYLKPTFSNQDGRKQKQSTKNQFKVLILDVYIAWLEDPEQSIGIGFTKRYYKVGSRYNALHISYKIVDVAKELIELGLLEHQLGTEGARKVTRIWPSEELQQLFRASDIPVESINSHEHEECIVLNGIDPSDALQEDFEPKAKPLEYNDSEHPQIPEWRETLKAYNDLLSKTYVDIYDLEQPWVKRTKTIKGKEKTYIVRIDQNHKFVRRVFYRGSWELGGRFHGGFWQQIKEEQRAKILINEKPTVEVDFKGMHVNLAYALEGLQPPKDPYNLKEVYLEGYTKEGQRKVVKELVLMGFNAKTTKTAFMAFRDNNKGTSEAKLKDKILGMLLEKFVEEHPKIENYLCNDQGVHLMRLDGEIAYEVIREFTKRKLPILCIHDSFIVEHTQDDLLRQLMDKMTSKVVGRKLTLESDTLGMGGVQTLNNLDPNDRLSNYKRIEQLRKQHSKVVRCKGYIERIHKWTQWMVANSGK